MEYRLLDRCTPAVAEFAELLADGETVELVPYSEFEKALAEGARGRSAGVGSYW